MNDTIPTNTNLNEDQPQDKIDLKASTQQAVRIYSIKALHFYDPWVIGFSSNFLWRCPSKVLREHFAKHCSGQHLELGVGSGYFLEHIEQPLPRRLVLVDLNPQALAFVCKRLHRALPCYRRNLLNPLDLPEAQFDSIALNYVLHCIPGQMINKANTVIENALPYLRHGGVIFGSTILPSGVLSSPLATWLQHAYQRKGIFNNQQDSVAELSHVLHTRFEHVEIEQYGDVILFSAQFPKNMGE